MASTRSFGGDRARRGRAMVGMVAVRGIAAITHSLAPLSLPRSTMLSPASTALRRTRVTGDIITVARPEHRPSHHRARRTVHLASSLHV